MQCYELSFNETTTKNVLSQGSDKISLPAQEEKQGWERKPLVKTQLEGNRGTERERVHRLSTLGTSDSTLLAHPPSSGLGGPEAPTFCSSHQKTHTWTKATRPPSTAPPSCTPHGPEERAMKTSWRRKVQHCQLGARACGEKIRPRGVSTYWEAGCLWTVVFGKELLTNIRAPQLPHASPRLQMHLECFVHESLANTDLLGSGPEGLQGTQAMVVLSLGMLLVQNSEMRMHGDIQGKALNSGCCF